MSLIAMQIAVACAWICLLNVLTILALKVLNRESHAIPHMVFFAATQASLVSDSDVLESTKGPAIVFTKPIPASSRLYAVHVYRLQQQFERVWQPVPGCQQLLIVLWVQSISPWQLLLLCPKPVYVMLYPCTC